MRFKDLKSEIIEKSKCSICGGCEVSCPVDVIEIDNEPNLSGECIGCGNCYEICPVTETKIEPNKIRNYFSARTTDDKIRVKSQNGGVVSTILKNLFKEDKIDSAIVVGENNWEPVSKSIDNKKDVIKSSGTKYGFVSLLKEVNNVPKENKIAIIGTPCHTKAAKSLKDKKIGNISFIISVFCMRNFEFECLIQEINKKGIEKEDIKKMEIDKGNFFVRTDEETIDFPLKDLKNCFQEACESCQDFDGKYSDISIGSVGSSPKYSTVLVRTKKGMKAIESAKKELIKKDLSDIDKIKKLDKVKSK